MGKKIKEGTKGNASQFITRSKAIRKLQVSLKDFRRLCILKGIFPREPRKKFEGNNKTYYHVKDISYLSHEKVLEKFRAIKTALRKYKKYMRKDNPDKAKKIKENLPTYTLNHIVKERYPSFTDALKDLDDPLCLINLFSVFQAHKLFDIPHDRIDHCIRLGKEFNFYVIKSRSLRKVFLSIKGIYYQAEILGQTVTWIAPYQFTQKLPADVDYKVMLTFLEFYETLLKFVNFKLFGSLGLSYPPKIDQALENSLDAFSFSTMVAENKEHNIESNILEEKYQISKEFNEDETVQAINNKFSNPHATLFEGLVFFCNREVPRYSLEFVILSFGGIVLWDSDTVSIDDKRITHVLTDRDPKHLKMQSGREYVQPQWVYDCINNQILLPVEEYAPGKILPPHLSPFVDAKAEGGYKPERQIQIEKLKGEFDENQVQPGEAEEEYVDDEADDTTFEVEKVSKRQAKKAKAEEEEIKKLSETIMTKKKKKIYDKLVQEEEKLKQKGKQLKEKKDKMKKRKADIDEEDDE